MALVKVLDALDLEREFKAMDRDYFSMDGYRAIIEWFEETDGNGFTDLDVVGICCDFNEDDPEDIIENYSNLDDIAECKDEDGNIDTEALLNALSMHTVCNELPNGNILYLQF